MARGTLKVAVGASPIASEHRRLVKSALRRGELEPEIAEGTRLEGSYSEVAIRLDLNKRKVPVHMNKFGKPYRGGANARPY